MQVLDADAHIEEGPAAWQYLDAEFYPRRPIAVTFEKDTVWGPHNAVWLIDYKVRQFAATPTTMERAQTKLESIGAQDLTDVAARLGDMDEFGIERQVIYPSLWLGCLAEDVTLEAALACSYNQFMATQCNQSGGRLLYSAVLPYRDPDAAVAEIERVAALGSAVSLFIRGMDWDLPITHPQFWPIYAAAERHNLSMALHIGFGSPTIVRLFEGLPRSSRNGHIPVAQSLGSGLLSSGLSQYALACVLNSTVLDDFPRLRWVVLETGSEWIPPLVKAQSHRHGRDLAKYFREAQIYVSAEPHEDIPLVMKTLGEDCLVVASDMPHADDFHHDCPEEAWRERGDLSEAVLEKLLRQNTARLYGL
jgi:predicted TIM-barrel fold metal-dependent hydrolase